MQKNKNKKLRFAVGSALVGAFAVKFLAIGLGSLVASFYIPSGIAQAEFLSKKIPSDFRYQTNTLKNLRAVNLPTFVGKPVKIPFDSTNPEGIPSVDQDYLYLFPPQFLNEKASIPLRTLYLSTGKTIDAQSAEFAKNAPAFVESIAVNNPALLEIIKNLLESNLKLSIKDDKSLVSLLIAQVHAEDTALDTAINSLLTSDESGELPSTLDTSDPQVKQLLVILLLLIIMNQSLAQSLNQDKQDCLDGGGEWTNNECVNEETSACKENGGMWKQFNNNCLKDKQSCGNEDLQCSNEQDTDVDGAKPYGCACKAGSCLNENGTCIEEDDGQQAICEDSGGTWREFFSEKELCLQSCNATSSKCNNDPASYIYSSTSSSTLKGCECGDASDNSTQWSTTGTNTTSAGKCLASSGKCIAKENTNQDDDNDGVPNGQDRCPSSAPDGSGMVNKQAGSNYYGCTCSQIQAMGGIQKPQCPADGCEPGTEYMVKYDRTQQNNNSALCQNGIVQQQQQNATCPVISRTPTQECADLADRMKNNQNKNDNLNDLLKKLMDDKKKQDQKDKDKQQQGGGGGGGGGGTGTGPGDTKPTGNQNTNTSTQPGPESGPPTSTTGDIGAYNQGQDGSQAKPYGLHPSQFKKVCGENTYVLTSATQNGKKFKNETKGQSASNGSVGNITKPNLKDYCSGGTCNSKIPAVQQLIDNNWSRMDQKNQELVSNALKNGQGLDDMKMTKVIDLLNKAPKSATPQTPATPGTPGADTMKDLKTPQGGANSSEIYFKAPKCEELAAAHCCVCSCCDPKKKDCGWNISKNCKDGKCEGQKCTGDSCDKCHEVAEKSIQVEMGQISEVLKCNNTGDKTETSKKLCDNYKESTHAGICRYDCSAKTEGCESERENCKIIINVGEDPNGQNDLQFMRKEDSGKLTQPAPQAKRVEFTNEDSGSIIKATKGVDSSWIKSKKLSREGGKACKCGERDEISDTNLPPTPFDGIASQASVQPQQQQPTQQTPPQPPQPQQQQPAQSDASYVGDRVEDWNPSTGKPQQTTDWGPESGTMPNWDTNNLSAPANNNYQSGYIPESQVSSMRQDNSDFNKYITDYKYLQDDKTPTWEEWGKYQNYLKWKDTVTGKFWNMIGRGSFKDFIK